MKGLGCQTKAGIVGVAVGADAGGREAGPTGIRAEAKAAAQEGAGDMWPAGLVVITRERSWVFS